MGPIEEIASGGELSRVMLALKASVEAGRLHAKSSDAQRSLVFDEIDTGIGGRAADAVGKKLKALIAHQAGSLHHPPAANCLLCRPAFPDREARERGAHQDHGPAA